MCDIQHSDAFHTPVESSNSCVLEWREFRGCGVRRSVGVCDSTAQPSSAFSTRGDGQGSSAVLHVHTQSSGLCMFHQSGGSTESTTSFKAALSPMYFLFFLYYIIIKTLCVMECRARTSDKQTGPLIHDGMTDSYEPEENCLSGKCRLTWWPSRAFAL